ncbi:hypothetical protein C3495_03335 [Clostridiaceae bacterium 14S0207]|nr:hypothetical protein C3495_03335 [Clostridiaceae bacterium 14S0207]
MRNSNLEKTIVKMDNDIAALNLVKKYLSNTEEIDTVRDDLNRKRQLLANELYSEDYKSYDECCDIIREMLDKKLYKDDQFKLLETIKEVYGRQSPNVSKKGGGLNAWLKELDIQCTWVKDDESDWDILIISGFGLHK